MNDKQKAAILMRTHHARPANTGAYIMEELKQFNVPELKKEQFREELQVIYNEGIKLLNSNQLKNIIEKSEELDTEWVSERLNYYEVPTKNHKNIIKTISSYMKSLEPIKVEDLDVDFKGVQVASRDDFDTIVNQGYTGDWVLSPEKIIEQRVQVASINDEGKYNRGWYLNADIDKVESFKYENQTRYRIYIKNPQIINSGNPNVKFNQNPVSYID